MSSGRDSGLGWPIDPRRAADRRRTLPVAASGRNKRPAIAPPGERSQRRTSRFRTGSAASNIEARRATRRRFVDPSAMTSSFETLSISHPRDRPICVPRRVFLSSGRSVPCASATTDLTSTIRIDRVPGCQAAMSTEPRSPNSLNVTSSAASQPAARSSPTIRSTRVACASSSNRSRASPRHRIRTSRSAPSAWQMRSRRSRSECLISPRSTFETKALEAPAAMATSACRQPRRIRSARSERPRRRRSISRHGRDWHSSRAYASAGRQRRVVSVQLARPAAAQLGRVGGQPFGDADLTPRRLVRCEER